jgi:hypothetical protein
MFMNKPVLIGAEEPYKTQLWGTRLFSARGMFFACPWIGMCIIACPIISGHQGIQAEADRHAQN